MEYKPLRKVLMFITILNMVAPRMVEGAGSNSLIKNENLPKLNGTNYKEWSMTFVTVLMAGDLAAYMLITKGKSAVMRAAKKIDEKEGLEPVFDDERTIATPSPKRNAKKKKKKATPRLETNEEGSEKGSSDDDSSDDDMPLLEGVQTRLFSYLYHMVQLRTIKQFGFTTYCQKFLDAGHYPDGYAFFLWLKAKYGNSQVHAQTAIQIEIPVMKQGQHSGREKAFRLTEVLLLS